MYYPPMSWIINDAGIRGLGELHVDTAGGRTYILTKAGVAYCKRGMEGAYPVDLTPGLVGLFDTADHGYTAAALDRRDRDNSHRHGEPVYVRFGAIPAGGRSYNQREGQHEVGVSTYRAYRQASGKIMVDAQHSNALSLATEREMYIIAGDVAGTGGDGEPLLVNCTVIEIVTDWDWI